MCVYGYMYMYVYMYCNRYLCLFFISECMEDCWLPCHFSVSSLDNTVTSHYEYHSISCRLQLDYLFFGLFWLTSKKISKLHITGYWPFGRGRLNPSVTDGFPSQKASNVEIISMSSYHHGSMKVSKTIDPHPLSLWVHMTMTHYTTAL